VEETMTDKEKKAEDRGFYRGIFYSAATLISIHHEGAAEQLIKESGLSWADLQKAKIDSYDRKFLKRIKQVFKV
jgi:uncharacterized protein YbjT (DUF2867 family)